MYRDSGLWGEADTLGHSARESAVNRGTSAGNRKHFLGRAHSVVVQRFCPPNCSGKLSPAQFGMLSDQLGPTGNRRAPWTDNGIVYEDGKAVLAGRGGVGAKATVGARPGGQSVTMPLSGIMFANDW